MSLCATSDEMQPVFFTRFLVHTQTAADTHTHTHIHTHTHTHTLAKGRITSPDAHAAGSYLHGNKLRTEE